MTVKDLKKRVAFSTRLKRQIAAHAALIISAMYIVFFCIDRVNSNMEFVDHKYTEALMLILCVLSALNAVYLLKQAITDDKKRAYKAGRRSKPLKDILYHEPVLTAVLPVSAICGILLLIQLIAPDLSIVHAFIVKLLLLILAVAAIAVAVKRIARERNYERAVMRQLITLAQKARRQRNA